MKNTTSLRVGRGRGESPFYVMQGQIKILNKEIVPLLLLYWIIGCKMCWPIKFYLNLVTHMPHKKRRSGWVCL